MSDIRGMVEHWVQSPVYGYLGSDYGSDVKALLQQPHASPEANAVIAKMRQDIPLFGGVPAEAVNIFAVSTSPDQLHLFIDVNGDKVEIR